MEEMVKKMLYTGVGLVALTAEKLQETIDDMVKNGRVSEDEGKKVVDDFKQKVEGQKDDMETWLKKLADEVSASMKLPRMVDREEYDALLQRVETLEAQLNAAAPQGEEAGKSVKKKAGSETAVTK
jgi:polyhydroxyalkanoate synthesis regulator phasin